MFVNIHGFPAYDSLRNELPDFEHGVEQVFNNFLRTSTVTEKAFAPAIDVVENENETLLVAELPGVSKEDVKLSLENNILTISGTRKNHSLPEKANWLRNEIRKGDFTRSVKLPKGIDSTKISAEITNGFLRISLPKADEVKPREIRIN